MRFYLILHKKIIMELFHSIHLKVYFFITDFFFFEEKYYVGGFFPDVPSKSRQKPKFFSFFSSVKFLEESFKLDFYNPLLPPDCTINETCFQFLDLTVIGNIGLKYDMKFIVYASHGNGSVCIRNVT